MVGRSERPAWQHPALRALLGAAIGGALGGVLWLLLFKAGFAPPRAQERLLLAGPVVLGWLIGLGALIGAWGRAALSATESILLPADISPGARRLYLLGGLIAFLAVVQYHLSAFLLRDPTDLPSFIFAARAMAAGENIYDVEVIRNFASEALGDRTIFPYLYLPLYAVLLRPLAALADPGAHAFFLVLNVFLWPLLILLVMRLIEPAEQLRGPLAVLLVLIVPSFLPTIQTFHHGSPSLLVAVLVVGTLLATRLERHRLAGVLLAFAVLIKIVPVVLVLYLLLRRRLPVLLWAVIAGAVLMLLSVVVAGIEPHLHWLTQMAPGLAYGAETGTAFAPGCHPENQALTGLFCRFLGAEASSYRQFASIVGAILVVLMGLVVWRRPGGGVDRLESSLVVVTILLVSTITWFHHMTLMLLPVLALIVSGAEGRGRGARVVLAIGAVALVGVGFEFYLDPWPFVGPNPLSRSIRFQVMLVCWVTLFVLILRDGFVSERQRSTSESSPSTSESSPSTETSSSIR